MGIIGRTDLIRHLRDTAPKPRATGAYRKRNERLPDLGYSSYAEYLKSEDWKAIRKSVLSQFPNCCCCEQAACQVHHFDYSDPVMLGLVPELLFPVCDACHELIEFADGHKRPLRSAQRELKDRLRGIFRKRLYDGRRLVGRMESQWNREKGRKKNQSRGKRPTKNYLNTDHYLPTGTPYTVASIDGKNPVRKVASEVVTVPARGSRSLGPEVRFVISEGVYGFARKDTLRELR